MLRNNIYGNERKRAERKPIGNDAFEPIAIPRSNQAGCTTSAAMPSSCGGVSRNISTMPKHHCADDQDDRARDIPIGRTKKIHRFTIDEIHMRSVGKL